MYGFKGGGTNEQLSLELSPAPLTSILYEVDVGSFGKKYASIIAGNMCVLSPSYKKDRKIFFVMRV
jgi:hypothetical protein